MNYDEVLNELKAIRKEKSESYKYWTGSKRKIRPSERAMTLASLNREIEALDQAILVYEKSDEQ